jgi:predicted CxxxxCH...CXXCH cytochrome family protein
MRYASGDGRTKIRNRIGWLVLALLLCLSTPVWASEMISNGGFDGATGWTFGGNGAQSYSTAQNNGVLTGAGSFLQDTTGRNKTWAGTASQAVSVSSGAVISNKTDISLYGMEEFFVASSDATVTIDLRYQDASSVQVFSGTVSANSSWSQITNNTATAFPLNLNQNVNQITVSVTAISAGSDKNAYSHVYVDDIIISFIAAATDNMTVTASTNVSTTGQPGQTDIQMMYMQLNSDAIGNGNCIVSDVTINDTIVAAVGTISNVQIHIDDDNNFLNGTLGFNTTGAWDGASTLVDLTGIAEASRTIVAGTPKFVWLLYDIDAGSATGIQAQLQVTDVGVLAPDNGPISGPWDSNIIDINTGLGCGGCHPNPMVDGASRNPTDGGVEGDHTKHATAQGYECTLCHLAVSENPRHRDTFITMTETVGTITNATYTTTGKSGVVTDPGVSVEWPQNTVPVRGNCQNTNCHGGINSAGDYGGPTGAGPQWGTTNNDTCTFCHNSNKTNSGGVANANPSSTSVFRSAADAGAHAVHMAGSSGLMNGGVVCVDCHTVPAAITDVGHIDDQGTPPYTMAPADVPFPVGSDAKLNSYAAAYDDNDINMTCAVYCHSAYDAAAVATKGSNTIPKWTDNWSNYDGDTACSTSCHLVPPETGTHDKGGSVYYTLTECNPCHNTTVTDTLAMPTMGTTHIDGTVDSSGCTGCHGTDPKQYPPVSATATTGSDDAIGAHVVHIEKTATLMSKEAIGGEADLTGYWCAECHTTTRGAGGHADAYPAEVTFPDAIESKYGSVTEAFTADGVIDDGTGGSCVTYCHSAYDAAAADTKGTNTQPAWTDLWANYGDGSPACSTACHLVPPQTGTHDKGGAVYYTLTECNPCHASTVTDTQAMPTIGTATHINGSVEASGDCDSCHAYPPDPLDGKNVQAIEGKGAHVVHVNKILTLTGQSLDAPSDTFTGANVAAVCGVCHDTSSDTNHSTGGGTRQMSISTSTSYQFGASAPSYNGTEDVSSGTTPKTCSSVSCHFKTTPVWEAP